MDAIVSKAGYVLLQVRVQPKASRNAVTVESDGPIRVALTAPPVEGAANKALVAFLAERLGIAKRCVELVKGEKSREKTVRVTGMEADEVRRKLISC
jgi:uncharacterized protein (TIGR00251 family)